MFQTAIHRWLGCLLAASLICPVSLAGEADVDDLFGDPQPAEQPAEGEVDDLFGAPPEEAEDDPFGTGDEPAEQDDPFGAPADPPADGDTDDLFGDSEDAANPPADGETDDLFGDPDKPVADPQDADPAPATGSIEELVEQAAGDDLEQQMDAIDALAAMGRRAAPAIDTLRAALKSPEPMVRARAARALGNIGPEAKSAAGDLADVLADEDPLVRRWVVDALGDIKLDQDVIVPLMLKALGDKDPSVVLPALRTMAETGPDVVPAMVKALEDERTQYWALLVLHEMGEDAKPAIPAIQKTLDSELQEVRLEAALTLGNMGELAADSAPAIAKLLQDQESGVRLGAVFALGQIGKPAKPFETEIVAVANNGDMMAEAIAVWTLARLNPDSAKLRERALPRMMKLVEQGDRRVKNAAVRTIYELNVPPDQLRPMFQELLETADDDTLHEVFDAIAALGPVVVPRLVDALQTDETRLRVIEILGRLGEHAKDAAPAVVKHVEDENPAIRREALFTLGSIGPAAADVATQAAIDALEDEDEDVRLSAVYALGQFGPKAGKAEEILRGKLGGDDPFFCTACAWALVRIDPEDVETAKHAVPLLIESLDNEREFVRMEAINTLGMLGPAAEPALERLREIAEGFNPTMAAAAQQAIEAIEQ